MGASRFFRSGRGSRLHSRWSARAIVAGASVFIACGARTSPESSESDGSRGGSRSGAGGTGERGGSAGDARGGTSSAGNASGGVAGGFAGGGVAGDGGAGGGVVAGAAGTPGDGGWGGEGGLGSAGVAGVAGEGGAGVAGEGGAGGESDSGGNGGDPAHGGGGGGPPRATALALGAFHTCAGFEGGSVRCWGSGGYLGRGDTTIIGDDEPARAAGDVEVGGAVTQISAGWYQTCARLDDGRARCWGDGYSGLLGHGNTDDIGDDETPAAAGDVNVGGSVAQLAAGASHTCARLTDGSVRCWGQNDSFQLGRSAPDVIGDDEVPASIEAVDVGGVVTDIAAGRVHTCALLDSGRVRCWGLGTGGRLGYANAETIGDDETPAAAGDVDVGGIALQVVAGMYHSCALLDTGSVRCWGVGNNGALGYGNTDTIGDDETPASAGDVDVGGVATQLAAGTWGTCALLTSGAVRCWGSGDAGELGYGNVEHVGDDETPASTGDVDIGGPVAAIGMGFLHTCAILRTGSIRCWGRGSTAALGYGNLEHIGDDEVPSSAGDVETH